MSELFRKEAIEHHTKKLDGEVMILPRLSHTVATVFIVIWIIAVIFWLSVSKYSKKETVKGWLEPAHGVTKVYSGSEGIITEVLVSEGEEVAINQPLAIVNGDRLLTDGNRLQSTLLQQYKKQRELVKQQLQRIQEIHLARLEDMSQQISSEQQNLLFIRDQIATKNQQLELVSTQLKNYEKLSKEGHASVYEENRSKKEFLSFVSDVQALRRTKVNQENTIQKLINEKGLLPEEHKNSLDKLLAELSQLNAEIAQINAKRAYVVKASQSGFVSNLQARVGKRASNLLPLLFILPGSSELTVKMLVPVRAAGFIERNQALNIRFDAFPYQKFGVYLGKVSDVSNTILLPNEQVEFPIRSDEPVYTIYGNLETQVIVEGDKQFRLKSGMTLSADIQLDSRSILQWLFEPILSLKGRM